MGVNEGGITMNALKSRKKYDAEQSEKEYEEWKRQEEEKIRNMTEEERAEYLKKEEYKKKNIASLLALIGLPDLFRQIKKQGRKEKINE